MKRIRLIWPVLILVICQTALPSTQVSEFVWITLRQKFAYEDEYKNCRDLGFNAPVTFVAEVRGGVAIRAEMRSSAYFQANDFYKRYPEYHPRNTSSSLRYKYEAPPTLILGKEEIVNLQFFRDKGERLWLKHLPLSARTLTWMLHPSEESCKPSRPQSTISPALVNFDFETAGMFEDIPFSYTQRVSLTTYVWDANTRAWAGNSTQADLRLVQTTYRP